MYARTIPQTVLYWLQKGYDLLFPLPAVCPVCLQRQPRLQVCDACRAEALQKRSLYGQCQCCHSFGVSSDHCGNCSQWPGYFVGNLTIWPYQQQWQQVILDFKFRNKPWLAEALAAELAPFLPADYDLLVPVPLHPRRMQERGYNQSALLAQAMSRYRGIPWENYLQRVRNTPHQTGLSRNQRLQNLDGAFDLSRKADVADKRILLVDDVFTTGTTLRACAGVLHRYGAREIMGVTLAAGHIS